MNRRLLLLHLVVIAIIILLRIHPEMPFLESPELTAMPLSLLSSDNSAPWGETEYEAALLRLERLQEQARRNVYAAYFCSTLTLLDK